MKLKLNLLWIAGQHILNIIMVIQIHYTLYMVSHILTNAKYFNLKYWTFKKAMHKKETLKEVFRIVVALDTFRI